MKRADVFISFSGYHWEVKQPSQGFKTGLLISFHDDKTYTNYVMILIILIM